MPNMTVTARRCLVSTGAVKPPAAGTCTTFMPTGAPNAGPIVVNTDSSGTFTFNNLQEGVYEITPSPTSVGLTAVAPTSRLFLESGNLDIERGDYTAN